MVVMVLYLSINKQYHLMLKVAQSLAGYNNLAYYHDTSDVNGNLYLILLWPWDSVFAIRHQGPIQAKLNK